MKYEVGNKIIIKHDLDINEPYGAFYLTTPMINAASKHEYIATVVKTWDITNSYTLDILPNISWWTDEMIAGFAPEVSFDEVLDFLKEEKDV